jgi:TP901 family phage tail tape measure protein
MQAQQKQINSSFNNRSIFGQAYGSNGQAGYANQITQMKALQNAFNTVNSMSGQYNVHAIQSASATETLTKQIQRNKFSYMDWARNGKLVNANLREQIALQRAASVSWGTTSTGKTMTSVLVPTGLQTKAKNLSGAIRDLSTRVGYYSNVVQSASRAGAEWGRGLQRTGFQITQGIGVPMAALAAVAGAAFYQVDKQLTGIAKVYDTTAKNVNNSQAEMAAQDRELNQLRQASLENAAQLAKKYGATVNDTLTAEQELAATGLKGAQLLKTTNEVQRIAILGELDQQAALKATISIQSIYQKEAEASGDATKWLSDQFNFMNQVENQTSLTTQDMVDAFPKILPVIKTMGGSIQDAAIFLTGFKQNGISAVEGANAFRTGINRLINPAGTVSARLKELGVDISDIGVKTNGDPLKMLELLSQRIEGLSNLEKQQVVGKLFGSYQVARMTALLDSLKTIRDVNVQTGEAVTQIGRAYQAAEGGAKQWQQTADTELARNMESASRKFKIMLSTIQANLAEAGAAVLPIATTILGGINKIVEGFNNLPDQAKKLLLIGVIATIIAGGIFLVVGAFTNLTLTILAAVSGFLRLVTQFKLLTPAQIAARQVTNNMTGALNSQATATGTATGKLTAYIAALRTAAAVQAGLKTVNPNGTVTNTIPAAAQATATTGPRNANVVMPVSNAPIMGPNVVNGRGLNGGYMQNGTQYTSRSGRGGRESFYANGRQIDETAYRRVEQSVKATEAATAAAAANSAKMAAQAKVARVSFLGIASAAGSLAMLPYMMSTLGDETASAGQKFTAIAITLGMMGPLLAGIVTRMKIIASAGLANGFRAAGMALAGMLGPVGLIVAGVVAVGVATYAVVKHLEQWKKDSAEINKSTQTWSDILGYTVTNLQGVEDKAAKTIDVQAKNVDKLKESNKALYKELQNVKSEEEAIAIARREGFKVAVTGGDQANVESAMRTALKAAGVNGKAQDAAIKLNMSVIVDNPEQLKQNLANELDQAVKAAIDEASNKNRNWFARTFAGADISRDARDAAAAAAGEFYAGFSQASVDQQGPMLKQFIDTFNKNAEPQFNILKKKYGDIFATLGINNAGDLARQMKLAENYSQSIENGTKSQAESMGMTQKQRAALGQLYVRVNKDAAQLVETEKVMSKTIAGNGDVTAESAKKVSDFSDLIAQSGLNINGTSSALVSGSNELGAYGDAAEGAAEEVAAVSDETKALQDQLREGLKSSMSSTMDAVYDSFAKKREEQQNAALDRIEAAGEARSDKLEAANEAKEKEFENRQKQADADFKNRKKALDAQQKTEDKNFDKQWQDQMDAHEKKFADQKKAAEDASDAQIQAIDDQIAAEEKADEIRERIFQAQQARVQRMSEMFNNTIDFNAALNSGNLDEAARIQNNASATAIQWSADDTAAIAGDGSKAKRDQLDAKKTAIEKEKQDRLDVIDELEKAEQQQLEDRKDREKEELEARQQALQDRLDAEQEAWNNSLSQEKDRYSKSADAQKKSLDAQINAQKKAAQAKFDAENASLEQQLAALKAMTPRNEQELNDHIGRLQALYSSFGTNYVKPTAQTWGQVFGNEQKWAMEAAANSLRDQVNWGEIGTSITDEMAGAFDMNGDQLLQWLKTGVFPGSGSGPSGGGGASGSSAGRISNGFSGGVVRHSGGPAWSSADRVGIPRTASLYPSETPAILKRGEVVMNERASRAFGPTLNSMNAGYGVVRHAGGPVQNGIGSAGMLGAAVAKALAQGIAQTLSQTVMAQAGAGYGVGAPGKYGNVSLTGEQLENASIIMSVGKQMGATQRDLIIALMTAMQESTLKNINYGDRDSLGLFQQRPSQGWGTAAQVTDPYYSSRKFFETLFKVKNRADLPLTQAAQKVQRSAFPNAYAKWEQMATAVVNGTPMMMNAAFAQGQMNAGGLGPDKNGYTYPALETLMSRSGVPYQVTSTKRNNDNGSLHNKGWAVDFDDFSSPKIDTPGLMAIWKWIYQNFGSRSSELIYAGPGATSIKNGKPHQYNAATMAAHHNHVHWGMTPDALAKLSSVPQLAVGGNIKYDNVLANLHKDETVLTAPLSQQLKDGISNLSLGGGGNIYITMPGMVVREEADIDRLASAISGKVAERNRRNGTGRTVKNV